MAGCFQAGQIVLPVLFLVGAQVVEGIPGVDTGIVAVIEVEADGIVADRIDSFDADILYAYLKYLLTRAMTLNLGRRGEGTEIFTGQVEAGTVFETVLLLLCVHV